MKQGANVSDQAQIKKLAAKGHKSAEISNGLQIAEPCVKSFMDKFAKEAKGGNSDEKAGTKGGI